MGYFTSFVIFPSPLLGSEVFGGNGSSSPVPSGCVGSQWAALSDSSWEVQAGYRCCPHLVLVTGLVSSAELNPTSLCGLNSHVVAEFQKVQK